MPSSSRPEFDNKAEKPTLRQRVRCWPIIGPCLGWLYGIARFNAIRNEIAQSLAEISALQQTYHVQVSQRLDRIDALNVEHRLRVLDARQAELDARQSEFEARQSEFEARQSEFEARQGEFDTRQGELDKVDLANRLARVEKMLGNIVTANNERDNRVAVLVQEFRRDKAPVPLGVPSETPPVVASGSAFDMDSFYVEFEGRFRGTREEILGRLKAYLSYISHLADDNSARVVDIGCGRGEWLELLKQQGIDAIGVDLNGDMIDTCRALGLQAECSDALAWLGRQPENSLAAVTGFHIIEHLPFELMIALFDAALRALRPDGFIIFETPNPENVSVGSCNFYSDPTHRRPLVPDVMEFIARQRGFAKAEILRLHPSPEFLCVQEDSDTARRLNHLFYGPQDFSVLAWKTLISEIPNKEE
jgi:SAM-dependent methyltransferase/Skp family chaperone for outer membrane proteins